MKNVALIVPALFVPAAALIAAGMATPAAAKTCREPVAVQFRTTVQASSESREKRARSGVVDKWRDRARADYGIAYRFWSRANDRNIECSATPKATTCKAVAAPCRLI